MAQAQLNAIQVDKLDTPTYTPRSPYNPKFSPPQSQDAFGLEAGHYDHRSRACMDREDFGILTTTMDGIITAMNVMSDQINNHTTMVVNELKEQREKNTKFMEKVDKKLLDLKKDIQKVQREFDQDEQGRTNQSKIIMKDGRESTIMLDRKLREIIQENLADVQRDNVLMFDKKLREITEQNQQLITEMEGILTNLQKEREEKEEEQETAVAAVEEPKKKGACFICQDPGHYAPNCPHKQQKKPAATYQGSNGYRGPNAYKGTNTGYQKSPYFQKRQDGPTIAERKQNSNCYHCGEPGHWASDCPIKEIPAYDEEFWSDVDNLIQKENEAPPQPVQQAPPQPIQQQETNMEFMESQPPAPPAAPKKRKLSLKKKQNQ